MSKQPAGCKKPARTFDEKLKRPNQEVSKIRKRGKCNFHSTVKSLYNHMQTALNLLTFEYISEGDR